MDNEFEDNNETKIKQDDYSDIFKFRSITLPYILNENIVSIGFSSEFLLIANKKNEIFRWIFKDSESTKVTYPIPFFSPEKISVSRIFCDPKGYHTIIFLSNSTTNISYYFNLKSQKFKELYKLKDIHIDSVAWDEANTTEFSTNNILIGTDTGTIINYQIDWDPKKDILIEKSLPVMTLKGVIHGIAFETLTLKNNDQLRYVLVVSETHFYQFIGPLNFEALFKKYKEPKYLENAVKIFPPGDIQRSQLQMLHVNNTLHSFGWMTGAGFCFGSYSNDPYDILIKSFTVVPYAKIAADSSLITSESPKSVAHSEYHIFLLFSDCITIISKINNNIVHTEAHKGNILNIFYDQTKNCIWMHSAKNVYQLSIENEDRDIWKLHLEKENFDLALQHCENKKLPFERQVARLYANHIFNNKLYMEAAVMYTKSDEKFEEVALKFLSCQQYTALKVFLEIIESKFKDTDFTQKSLINTWMVEIYLNEINSTTGEEERKTIIRSIRHLLKSKGKFLDKNTIYQLLQHYGNVSEFLYFAKEKRDYETIIVHFINEKNVAKALTSLKLFCEKEPKISELFDLFAKYAQIFMKIEPELAIDVLIESFKKNIDTKKILSSIMSTEISKREKVIYFLEKLIYDNLCKDKNIHNLYIFFLCQISETNPLLIEKLVGYLEEKSKNNSIDFDLDYGLKVFSHYKIFPAQSYALSMAQKYDEAIKVALTNNCVNEAKKIAAVVKDKKIQKRLWIEIFIYQIKQNSDNIKFAIEIMNESKVLKIEDVLPHITDNIRIEVFKEEIHECIKKYEEDNNELKDDISRYNSIAQNIKSDILKVKKKHIDIKYRHCICDVCNTNCKEDNIYIFPCKHVFDSNCIIQLLEKYAHLLPLLQGKLDRIVVLRKNIDRLERKKQRSNIAIDFDTLEQEGMTLMQAFQGYFSGKNHTKSTVSISFDELGKLANYHAEFNELLSEECMLCGDLIVDSIMFPIQIDDSNKKSWLIN